MQVLVVNTSNSRGGADLAALRLVESLGREGIDVSLLLLKNGVHLPQVIPNTRWISHQLFLAKLITRLPVLLYSHRWRNLRTLNFSPAPSYFDSSSQIGGKFDLVHLHWINHGHLSPEGIGRISQPIVWTAHDMWPFTGGCHYSEDCLRYRAACGSCPVLGSCTANDLSHQIHQRKQNAWADRNISLVTPSTWLAKEAATSTLFANRNISVIPNPLDLEFFRPRDKAAARAKFGLPADLPVALFAADAAFRSPRKGFDLLSEALTHLAQRKSGPKLRLLVAGGDPHEISRREPPFDIQVLGKLSPELMVDAYAACDIVVLPTRQDNLPNVVAEALACGRPVVAFAVGGTTDMIDHGINGYLAKPQDVGDLETGLLAAIERARDGAQWNDAARQKAEAMFDPRTVARKYIRLYETLLADASARRR